MANYKEICNRLTGSASGDNGSRRFSKSDVIELTRGLLNDEDHEVSYYSNPSGDTPVSVTKKPAYAYRESLKNVLTEFGVDKNEANRIHDIEFDKKHAEALMDVAQVVQHDYMATGKKLKLPQLSANETTVTLQHEVAAEKIEATKKNVVGPDGTSQQVPTGKTIKTDTRTVTKAGNKVPGWLKHEVH